VQVLPESGKTCTVAKLFVIIIVYLLMGFYAYEEKAEKAIGR
jgi:hypothetical protein